MVKNKLYFSFFTFFLLKSIKNFVYPKFIIFIIKIHNSILIGHVSSNKTKKKIGLKTFQDIKKKSLHVFGSISLSL